MNLGLLLQFWVVAIAGRINAYQHAVIAYKDEEIRCLREQLKKSTGKDRPRFTNQQRIRLATKAKELGRATLCKINPLVTPDTLLRWHRKLIAQKYDSSRAPKTGRPVIAEEIKELVLQFARQNPGWGYARIVGELGKLGHTVCESTVSNVLHANGLDPVPDRDKLSWDDFLKAHWDSLAATDFFTVEVWHHFRLVRYLVLFVIDLKTRKVTIVGIAPEPDGQWMKQMARNMTDCFDGPLKDKTMLIHDRDPLFTKKFRQILKAAGVSSKKLPPRSPNLNAYAERFVRSIKHECLNKMIFFSEKQLRHVINEYVEHYNIERPHQGIGNVPIEPVEEQSVVGKIACRQRLGGMLKHYYRKAA
ncbi:MAG: integrase core domain-containing protein [Planctomycetota bacterium]